MKTAARCSWQSRDL